MKVLKKFFKIYSAVFVVLGLLSYLSLHEAAPLKIIETNLLGREPASVQPRKLNATEILKVGCNDKEKEISVNALQVRVDGTLCKSRQNAHLVALENQTTGQPAILFQNGNSQFTTDYIQLRNGKNQMSLTYTLGNQIQKMDFVLVQ